MAVFERVLINHFPDIIAAMPDLVGDIVRKTAFDVQATAAANAKVVTGFLKSSIYVVTDKTSSYGQNVVDGAPGSYLLPPVEPPTDSYTAFIAVGANYGIFVEYGTYKMAAQPYLTPAADTISQSFASAFAKLDTSLQAWGVI